MTAATQTAQAGVSAAGSKILTQWLMQRQLEKAGQVRNDSGTVTQGTVTYSPEVLEAFGVTPNVAGVAVTPLSAMRVAAVFACVQKIAGAIATLPLDVFRTDGQTPVKLPRDALWYFLNEQPSIQFTAASHWEGVSVNQLLRGDSYTWIRRSTFGKITELLPLPWASVTPVQQPDWSVRYYVSYQGLQTWLSPDEIFHFPGFGFDGLKSMSVISYAARNAVGNALAMDVYSGKFFEQGASPSIVLKTDRLMTDEKIFSLQQTFTNKYSGLDKAHRLPLVLTEGMNFSQVSINAKDAQLLEARQFQVVDIARAFGVPPHMIGETTANTSWGSGIEAMSRGFVTYTLQPHLRRIETELNRKLFPNNSARFVRFDREALTEGDSQAQAEYFRAALGGPGTGRGWMTVDEIRQKKGLPPKGGELDEIYDPANQPQPVKQPQKQEATA